MNYELPLIVKLTNQIEEWLSLYETREFVYIITLFKCVVWNQDVLSSHIEAFNSFLFYSTRLNATVWIRLKPLPRFEYKVLQLIGIIGVLHVNLWWIWKFYFYFIITTNDVKSVQVEWRDSHECMSEHK